MKSTEPFCNEAHEEGHHQRSPANCTGEHSSSSHRACRCAHVCCGLHARRWEWRVAGAGRAGPPPFFFLPAPSRRGSFVFLLLARSCFACLQLRTRGKNCEMVSCAACRHTFRQSTVLLNAGRRMQVCFCACGGSAHRIVEGTRLLQ